jgi:rfaE bifunctional protein kinase chain/domain/rfaE bifunctional protein nucleotidyltransferase chain/domain
MSLDFRRKVCAQARLNELADADRAAGRTVVLCHGCFDIVHPGHLHYLQFARQQGDVLVVSITGDDAIEKGDGARPYVPQEHRAENLAALEFVDRVVIVDGPTAEPVIRALRPDVYIKGREYEHSSHPGFLAEKMLVESLGGRVVFSSGDVVYSSSAILDQLGAAIARDGFDDAARLAACCRRWGVDHATLRRLIAGFRDRTVVVIGDAMLDHYVLCDASDVAGEAPILSVKPMRDAIFPGGAAIVAAHLKALGARPHLVTTIGRDAASAQLIERLDEAGIERTTFDIRQQLPTKTRYLVETQKLLKVDRVEAQPLDTATQRDLIGTVRDLVAGNAGGGAIVCDFGCGVVGPALLRELMPVLSRQCAVVAGDVSGRSQSLTAYHGATWLTPTERELRQACADFEQSLPAVAARLMKQLRVPNLAVTMGSRGCVLFRPREEEPGHWFESRLRSEYLPALNTQSVDPLGAGDAYLAASTLALLAGATLPQAGYIGSAASAVAVSRIGNQAVAGDDLLAFFRRRQELSAAVACVA